MKITAVLKGGKTIEQQADHGRGWPQRPATWENLRDKFKDCTHGILSPSQTEETVAMLKDLDSMRSVGELIRSVTPRK